MADPKILANPNNTQVQDSDIYPAPPDTRVPVSNPIDNYSGSGVQRPNVYPGDDEASQSLADRGTPRDLDHWANQHGESDQLMGDKDAWDEEDTNMRGSFQSKMRPTAAKVKPFVNPAHAIVVSAPDGSKVSFPKGTPTPQVNAEMSKWWEGHTQRAAQLWNGVKNYVSNASQAMGGPASIPELDADTKDFLLNPDETLKGAIGGLLKGMNTAVMSLGPGNEENKAMVQRAQQEWHDGNHLAAATTMIPLVGDGLAKAVKQAQAHDFSGSFGTATGVALPFVAGDAGIHESLGGLGDTAAQLRGRYLPKSTLTEAAPVAETTIKPTDTGGDADAEALKKALSGSAGENALFEKAKAELGPDATPSEVALRAQAMKIGAPAPKTPKIAGRSIGAASIDDLNTKEDVPTFFSKAARVIDEKAANTASGEQLAALLKNNGVKPDEMKWTGLDDYLKDKPKVSKADLQQFLQENQIKLNDVDVKGPKLTPEEAAELHTQVMRNAELFNIGDDRTPTQESEYQQGVARAKELEAKADASDKPTKYDKWTVPGERENYQEKLLTTPTTESSELQNLRKEYAAAEAERNKYSQSGSGVVPGDVELRFQDAQNAMRKMKNAESVNREYIGPHWGETPNVVAHVRFDDRPAVDGKKTLFMEEAQSDWHSAGRHEGYSGNPKEVEAAKRALQAAQEAKTALVQSVVDRVNATPYATPEEAAEHDALTQRMYTSRNNPLTAEEYEALQSRLKELKPKMDMNIQGQAKISPNSETMSERIRKAMTSDELTKFDKLNTDVASKYQATKALQGAVPDAPFKQNWHELVMKRMLRQAAENGYDRLAWTTGDQQAALYDLTKHIGRVEYDPEQNELRAYDPNGEKVIEENVDPTAKELAPYLGQALAEKLERKIDDYEPIHFNEDWAWEHAAENYDVEEREEPVDSEPGTVNERHEYNAYQAEIAKKYGYDPRIVSGNPYNWPGNRDAHLAELRAKLTPEEVQQAKALKSAAEEAEKEQEDNRETETKYYVTSAGGSEDGPYDSQREADEARDDMIRNDVQYEVDNYESAKDELPSIEGLDLKHGGEFHRLLYDQMIPSFLKKYAKKWGAQVGTTEIKGMGESTVEYQGPDKTLDELEKVDQSNWATTPIKQLREVKDDMRRGIPFKEAMSAVAVAQKDRGGNWLLSEHLGGKLINSPNNQKVHSIEITPEMRKSVMKEGQPIAKKEDKKKPFGRPGKNPEQNTEAANFKQRLNDRMLSALS